MKMTISGPVAKHLNEYEEGAILLMAMGATQEDLDQYGAFVAEEKKMDQETGKSFRERNPQYYPA